MSIIEKVFKYGETELSVIKCKDDIWFRGKTLAEVLGYSNPLKAIRMHIDSEDKKEMSELVYEGGAQNGHPFRNVQRGTIYINKSVVSFFKKRYPHSLFTVTLGENQDTVHKRIDSFKKGYLCGSPDLIINNLHKHYTGFCIEFNGPKGNGILSPDQSMILLQYQNNGFKTLVSNDYDHIIEQVIEYFRDVRIKCSYCPRRFIISQPLRNHIKFFHKM